MEGLISNIKYFFEIFLVCKLYKSGLQIMHLISDNFRPMERVDIRDFLVVWYLERLILTLNYFLSRFFLVWKFHKFCVQITYIALDHLRILDNVDNGDY